MQQVFAVYTRKTDKEWIDCSIDRRSLVAVDYSAD